MATFDTSIYQNLLSGVKSPEQFQEDRQQVEAGGLANALNRQKLDEYQQGVQRNTQLRNLLAGGAKAGDIRAAGFYKEAGDIDKSDAEIAAKRAQEKSSLATAGKADAETSIKTWEAYRDQSSMVRSPQEAAAWITRGYNDPVIGPYLQRFGSLEEGIKRIPTDPAGFEQWRMGVGMNVDKLATHALQQQEFGLKANNELIGPDGKINQTLLGAKKQVAQAGASSVNVNTGQKGFDNELKLRSDFKQEPVYKAHQEMQSAYSQIQQSLKQATPAGDLAGATKIMKLLDPGSVVRESELGMAMAATGLLDRAQNYASNIISGNKLTPKQRGEFQKLADALYGESIKQYNSKQGEYKKLGSEYGLNADRAIGAPASLAAKPGQANAGGAKFLGYE